MPGKASLYTKHIGQESSLLVIDPDAEGLLLSAGKLGVTT